MDTPISPTTNTDTDAATPAGHDTATIDLRAALQAAAQESPSMIPLRDELIASQDALYQAFLALIDAYANVKAARAAQEGRVRALEEAEAQAHQAALRTLAEGPAEAHHTERAADGRHQHLGSELTRGAVAIVELAQQAALASDAVQHAGERAGRAREAGMAALITARQQRRYTRTQELLAQLAQLVAEGRADNAEVTRLAQEQHMRSPRSSGHFPERSARQTRSDQLYLPGESVARAAATHSDKMGHLFAERGFFVAFAPDLSSAEVPEDQGRRVAEAKGVDLSALYQGWFL